MIALIEYANVTACRRIPDPSRPRGDGYGDKLPTEYQVQLNGSTVWRNVWAVCWSNAASLYVITAGNRRYIRESTFDTARDERPRK